MDGGRSFRGGRQTTVAVQCAGVHISGRDIIRRRRRRRGGMYPCMRQFQSLQEAIKKFNRIQSAV